MTDDKSTLPNILKWASEVSKGYLKMSLSEKLEELKKLKSVRSGLEEELKNAELKIMVLDGFHDVKDYKVKKDEVAVALLSEIKEKGESISYQDLTKSFDEQTKSITTHYLTKLKSAKYIEIKSGVRGDIISLTSKAKEINYDR